MLLVTRTADSKSRTSNGDMNNPYGFRIQGDIYIIRTDNASCLVSQDSITILRSNLISRISTECEMYCVRVGLNHIHIILRFEFLQIFPVAFCPTAFHFLNRLCHIIASLCNIRAINITTIVINNSGPTPGNQR